MIVISGYKKITRGLSENFALAKNHMLNERVRLIRDRIPADSGIATPKMNSKATMRGKKSRVSIQLQTKAAGIIL